MKLNIFFWGGGSYLILNYIFPNHRVILKIFGLFGVGPQDLLSNFLLGGVFLTNVLQAFFLKVSHKLRWTGIK